MSAKKPPHVGDVSRRAAAHLLQAASASLSARGEFVVALSGGSLPKLLAGGVGEGELEKAGVGRWTVLLADERMVALDDEESNYRLVRECFPGLGEEQVLAVDVGADVGGAVRDYEAKVGEAVAKSGGVFDAVYLGLGPDGHTASLFPGHELLGVEGVNVAGIWDSPKPPKERVTLTLGCINQARQIAFICTGEGKKEVVRSIFEDEGCRLPGALVGGEGELDWFVDEGAASAMRNAAKM